MTIEVPIVIDLCAGGPVAPVWQVAIRSARGFKQVRFAQAPTRGIELPPLPANRCFRPRAKVPPMGGMPPVGDVSPVVGVPPSTAPPAESVRAYSGCCWRLRREGAPAMELVRPSGGAG